MRIQLFVTSDQGGLERIQPLLVLPDVSAQALPPHPFGRNWKYFATSMTDDLLIGLSKGEAEEQLRTRGFFIYGAGTTVPAG